MDRPRRRRRAGRPLYPFTAWLALSGTLGLGGCDAPRPEARAGAQDLVLICMDTVRADVFWALDALAPDELTRWAQGAVRLERVQSTAPWTLPAIASVFTGLYPNHHGAGALPNAIADVDRWVPTQLKGGIATLPERLGEAGYTTTGLVAHRWFGSKFGLERGFGELAYLADAKIVEAVESFADDLGDPRPPYFLYLHWMSAHNYAKTRVTAETMELARTLAPAGPCGSASAACRPFAAYVTGVRRLRARIAASLDALAARGALEDAIVVLFSDHGEEFHDHRDQQLDLPRLPTARPGEGHGHSLYQELLRVPLLVWHPDLEGRRVDTGASLVDVLPTLAEWLELPSAGFEPHGESLAAALGGDPAVSERPLFSSGIAYGPAQVAVVRGRWKRVVRPGADHRTLLDLRSAPDERTASDDDAVARELDGLLEGYLAEQARELRSLRVPHLDADEVRALQALGYLEGAEAP